MSADCWASIWPNNQPELCSTIKIHRLVSEVQLNGVLPGDRIRSVGGRHRTPPPACRSALPPLYPWPGCSRHPAYHTCPPRLLVLLATGALIITSRCPWSLYCHAKPRRQYLLTLQVGRYRLLALRSCIFPKLFLRKSLSMSKTAYSDVLSN